MTRQRFIAGAVCPDCREIDRIVIRQTPAGEERACVACGFSEAAASVPATAAVPRGKPERRRDDPATRADVVKLVMPPRPSSAGDTSQSPKSED